MFGIFKKRELDLSPSGIYVIEESQIHPIASVPENNSILGISNHLGYADNQIAAAPLEDGHKIIAIVFKRRTKIPIFVIAREKTEAISYADVKKAIKSINWPAEFRQLEYEDRHRSDDLE